jgi:hypothetical protein
MAELSTAIEARDHRVSPGALNRAGLRNSRDGPPGRRGPLAFDSRGRQRRDDSLCFQCGKLALDLLAGRQLREALIH